MPLRRTSPYRSRTRPQLVVEPAQLLAQGVAPFVEAATQPVQTGLQLRAQLGPHVGVRLLDRVAEPWSAGWVRTTTTASSRAAHAPMPGFAGR
jgi:hypothetical protein